MRRFFNPNLFMGSIDGLIRPPARQIPFLDGLRTIAVLLVIGQHFSGKFAGACGPNFFSRLPFVANGWMGVDLFFVLSGFFIGGQLWRELRDTKSVNVRKFIVRRGLRIWPLYFFVFVCVLSFAMIAGYASVKEYGWSDLVFITNFHNKGLVMGSWSLCTEEQFYIVAPLILFLCAKNAGVIGESRRWLWAMLFLVPLLRAGIWIHMTGNFFKHSPEAFAPLYYSSLTHCDGLIIGLLISNYWVTGERPLSRLASPIVLLATAMVILIALHSFQKEVFDFTALALLFGSLVWCGVQYRLAMFDSRLFYWGSRLSFGMYLNHEYMCPWIVRMLHSSVHYSMPYEGFTNLLGVIVVTILSATLSLVTFCSVEHPFLQLREQIFEDRRNHLASRRLALSEAQAEGRV